MSEPLQKLLFAASTTSFSSVLSATRLINRPIDLIISDLFVLPPIWKAHEEKIPAYLFMPNSLMTFTRYINKSRETVENGGLGLNFDRQLHKTIPLANGLICNSFLELDKPVLNELRQQTTSGANMSILFLAPLISENLGQKQDVRVRLEIEFHKRTRHCFVLRFLPDIEFSRKLFFIYVSFSRDLVLRWSIHFH